MSTVELCFGILISATVIIAVIQYKLSESPDRRK